MRIEWHWKQCNFNIDLVDLNINNESVIKNIDEGSINFIWRGAWIHAPISVWMLVPNRHHRSSTIPYLPLEFETDRERKQQRKRKRKKIALNNKFINLCINECVYVWAYNGLAKFSCNMTFRHTVTEENGWVEYAISIYGLSVPFGLLKLVLLNGNRNVGSQMFKSFQTLDRTWECMGIRTCRSMIGWAQNDCRQWGFQPIETIRIWQKNRYKWVRLCLLSGLK